MLLSDIAVLLVIIPFCTASTCNPSAALSWPPSSNSSPGSGVPDACNNPNGSAVDCCAQVAGTDEKALQACLRNAGLGKLKTRAALSCTSRETCYQYTEGSLLCLDKNTGLYHDDIGGTGDYNTGEYTAPDGSMTTDLVGATATPTATTTSPGRTGGSLASSTLVRSASSTRKVTSASSIGSATSVTPASVTSSIRSAGAEGFHTGAGAGVIVGALGLVVRLAL
ncbi:hypothetical protein N431DRAFT_486384 [Stipitochalara longipes BDJ]|nr:hypothetical protein N431DRAFT_486384 [Stipitochalara longipes BDJ]